MISNKSTVGTKFDVRIILSALWAARMLSSVQGDTFRLSNPAFLKEMVAGTMEFQISNEMFLMMSIIMAIPIFMSFLSLTLKEKTNRLVNIIIGMFFVVWDIVFMVFFYFGMASYEIFWGIVYFVFAALIVWYAWRWPIKEA